MFDFFSHAGDHWFTVDYRQIALPVWGLILLALTFDYLNGMHDAANSIATVVSTRVLSPGQAVVWAAFFNFVAAFTFGTAVASTIGSKMIDVNVSGAAATLAGELKPGKAVALLHTPGLVEMLAPATCQ